jgi:adenylate cyclase
LRRELIDPAVAAHHGRIVKTTGDGLLIEFASVVDAVRCAIAMQRGIAAGSRAAVVPPIEYRVGVNHGDIVIDGDDILGDSVNIAARLEGVAAPGGICLSAAAHDQVTGKIDAEFADLGEQSLRNMLRPLRAYRVVL